MKKVLIVDDDLTNIKLIEQILINKLDIKSLSESVNIINVARKFNPDVILLDIMMPQKDGFECLKDLKDNYDLKDMPVIMISALIQQEDIKKSLDLGAFDYIKKPVIFYELLIKVKNAINYKTNLDKLKKYNDIYTSLIDSKRIQDSLLPDKKYKNSIFNNCEILSISKDIVSGDLYWINKINNKKYLFLGDCVGHGIPGAILSSIILTVLKNIDYNKYNTSREILNRISYNINNIINNIDTYTSYSSLDGAMLMIEEYNNNYIEVEYSGAKIDLVIISKEDFIKINDDIVKPNQSYNDLYLYKINSDCTQINNENYNYKYHINKIILKKNDRLFLWTDGIYEQIGINNDNKIKKYSKRKFIDFILTNQNCSLSNLNIMISDEFNNWKSNVEQIDDITFVAIEL